MKQLISLMVLGVTLSVSATRLVAQPTPAKATSVRDTFLNDLNDLEKKFVGLAGAVPEDKFGWRPAKGVRSFSEVYIHTAQSNYFFMSPLGLKEPAGMGQNAEKTITQKAKAVDALKASFAAMRQAVMKASEADLRKSTNLEGQQTTIEGALLITTGHIHEHLGQLIAYARMNGIAPPWS